MPSYIRAFPVGSQNVVIRTGAHTYTVDIDTHGFTRTGIDGAEKILALFADENFKGEYLEPSWKKGWDTNINANQAFTAIVNTTTDQLELEGEADVAGTWGYGWINSTLPIPLIDDLQISFAMISPIDDTGVTAARDIRQMFWLIPNKVETVPHGQTDALRIYYDVDENGIIYTIQKKVSGSYTALFNGSTYDDTSVRATGNLEATIWRIVFHEADSDTAYFHIHVYLKQSDTLANAESATENELSTSPFDISDLTFEMAYPCVDIGSQNTSYFDSGQPAIIDYIHVSYPDFNLEYDLSDANQNTGDVKIFDTRGKTDEDLWHQVFDKNYDFIGDCVVQNGLIRLYVDEAAQYGLKLYYWNGSSWVLQSYKRFFRLETGNIEVVYPFISKIKSISTEKIAIEVKCRNSAVEDDDYYIDLDVIINRGSHYVTFDPLSVYPIGVFKLTYVNNPVHRFVYAGDESITDVDIAVSSQNLTLTDNFGICFDDEGDAVIVLISTNIKPTEGSTRFYAYNLGWFEIDAWAPESITELIIQIGLIPFPLVANLFEEAESATISAAARLYMDGAGEDTTTEGQAVWAATANCVIDVNHATGADVSVGAKCVKITSSGAGAVHSTVTPGSPLGKLAKFDDLILYLHAYHGVEVVYTRLIDADGDYIEDGGTTIDAFATQYTLDIPHSDADLTTYGWTETGTFNYETLTSILFRWSAVGAGNIIYIDGLHEYIGTTTARGRGETLSGSSAVVLDANAEYVRYQITAGTHLPDGRYLFVYRAKDTDQVALDSQAYVYDTDDAQYKNQENIETYRALTASFAYYMIIFDISAEDVNDTDPFDLYVRKPIAGENTQFIDYILLLFLGDGENGPMDLAHNSLYKFSTTKDRYDPS